MHVNKRELLCGKRRLDAVLWVVRVALLWMWKEARRERGTKVGATFEDEWASGHTFSHTYKYVVDRILFLVSVPACMQMYTHTWSMSHRTASRCPLKAAKCKGVLSYCNVHGVVRCTLGTHQRQHKHVCWGAAMEGHYTLFTIFFWKVSVHFCLSDLIMLIDAGSFGYQSFHHGNVTLESCFTHQRHQLILRRLHKKS
jgi:hypothetical protein